MRRWFFVVVLLALSLVLIYTVDLSQEGLVKWQNAIQDKWSELAQESSPDGTDSDDNNTNDTTGDTPESPSSSDDDGAISTPTIVEGQTLVTMKNPKETDPTFEWGPPMPLVSPEEAKHYLKEDKGDRWLPHRIRQHVKMREKPVRVVSVFAIDCELDILEIRLMELYDVVDYFVIGESNYSQVGFAKRLHFWESRHRFERFWPKIRHLVFWEGFKPQVAKDEWHNEVHTRGWLAQGLRGLADDDLVIVTDADEIPTRDAVMFWRTFTGYPEHSKLFVRWSQMGFFWHVTKYGGMWGPVASLANYKLVKEIGTNGVRQAHGGGDWWPLGSHQVIAGWHCSWCFPSQDFINKFRNVIEPFWRQGSKLPEYSEEAMAQARYDGTIIGDPPFEMDHSNHPQAVTNHFRYMADREVRPGCGWCRRPESDSFNPIEHIQPTDPVPQDLVERSRKCSNDVTRTYTPHGPNPQRRR